MLSLLVKTRPGRAAQEKLGAPAKTVAMLAGVLLLCAGLIELFTRYVIDDGLLYELEMWKYARDVKVRDLQPDLGHRHQANREARLMGTTVRTNAMGFRGPEIAALASPGVARIAFVGDSITLGWGVAEQETFSHQVVADLARLGRKVDGFNLGVGNFNTTQELALFRKAGERMRPDVIVLTYFLNDAEPMPGYPRASWLTLNSAAWVVLSYRIDSLLRQFGGRPDWKKYYRDLYDADAAGWKKSEQAIAQFAQVARNLGAELIVFNVPELRELNPYPFADVTAKVRAAVEGQAVRFVDLLPTVEALEPSTLWVTVPDPHPNGRANDAFARQMTKDILPLLDRLCAARAKGC